MVIFLGVLAGVEFVALCIILFAFLAKKSDKSIVKEKDGIRYTKSDEIKNENGQVASFVKGDIILKVDKVYKVGVNGEIKPGRYNILSSQEDINKVTLKVNGISRSQTHNSGIVFANDDIVIAEKYSIILR